MALFRVAHVTRDTFTDDTAFSQLLNCALDVLLLARAYDDAGALFTQSAGDGQSNAERESVVTLNKTLTHQYWP